jgi:hypothetical protein
VEVMIVTLGLARNVCLYKLRAARYHHNMLETAYAESKAALLDWARNFQSTPPLAAMPLFYHLDSFLYQSVSCFHMLLQVLNMRSGINLPEKEVSWKSGTNSRNKTKFMKLLEQSDLVAYNKIDRHYRGELFSSLMMARDHVAHRGTQALYVSYSEEQGVTAVSIAGQPYEIVDRCKMWGEHVGSMLADVDPDLWQHV